MNRRASALYAVKRLGLLSGLKLCLDAGDASSYASGQTWSDISGQGTDFYRGAGSGSSTDDPTFNGTAGRLSKDEYFSFDGGDEFRLVAASNPTWVNNLHKNNAAAAFLWATWLPNVTSRCELFSTAQLSSSEVGIEYFIESGNIQLEINKGSNPAALDIASSTLTLATSRWQIHGLIVDEANSTVRFFVDGQFQDNTSAAFTAPSSSNATNKVRIGVDTGAFNFMPNGSRIALALAWEGRVLSKGEMTALYYFLRHRFGI